MPVSSDAPRPLRVLTAVAIVLMLLLGASNVVLEVRNTNTLEAQHHTDDLNGCRASWQAKLVTGPTFRGLKALAQRDEVALRAAVRDGDELRYEQLVRQSRFHPDEFLRDCRRQFP